jgi:hypothetical protein
MNLKIYESQLLHFDVMLAFNSYTYISNICNVK